MSSADAIILASTFVGCAVATLLFAALLFGAVPALACPSCRTPDLGTSEDWLCCIACNWMCWRCCGCCKPERLRKMLLEDVREMEKRAREEEEAEELAKREREEAAAETKAKGEEGIKNKNT